MKLIHAILGIGALCAVPAVHAVRAIDAPPPTRAAVVNAPKPDPVRQADDSASLRQGRVDAVAPNGDSIYINGAWVAIVVGRTRLFRQGRAVQPDVLGKGQVLRFTLAPGGAEPRTLGVVYVP